MKKTKKRPVKKIVFLCLFSMVLFTGFMADDAVAADSAPHPPKKVTSSKSPTGFVSVDFKDADIRTVIRSIAMMTGKNFIIDDKVKGKVTIISPRQVSVSEAMRVFESTLEVYGYTLINAGSAIKVVPSAEARQRSPYKPGEGSGDRMVTRLIPLKHVRATDIVNSLRPLIPPTSYMTGYKETNTLIVADYESNIDKILRIVGELDTPKHEESVTVIHLQYAGAKELSRRLAKIYKDRPSGLGVVKALKGGARMARIGSSGGGSGPKFIPDERINAIILVAGKTVTDQILSLISQLDIPPPPGRGGINVYMLKNADAEEVAKVLNNITGGKNTTRRKGGPSTRVPKLRSNVNVTPDKATNSLVITGSVEDYETLREVIEKLDVRRAQVFVEALIMEVTTSKTKQFGVEWRTTSNFSEPGVKAIGGTNFGNINNVAQNPLDTPTGLAIGVIDGTISFGGKEFLNLGALVHALQSETDINILSTPNIMTTDNEEAKIVVAQQVPFSTGAAQNTGGTTLTTIERKDVGLTLKITPQISESNDVRLEVYQEISSISPVQIDKAQDIITNTRSIETTVIVKDKQNVVLGGLIRDNLNDVENKVPFLGDIPIIGWLFKSSSKEWQKTNLLVFLTPHIIRRKSDIDRITNAQKLNESAPEEFKNRLLDLRHKDSEGSDTDRQEPEGERAK